MVFDGNETAMRLPREILQFQEIWKATGCFAFTTSGKKTKLTNQCHDLSRTFVISPYFQTTAFNSNRT